VPVATTWLAEIVAGDPHPLEIRRGSDHFAQQLAVGGLNSGALGQGQARLGDTVSEIIAEALERAEIENPRLARRCRDRAVEPHPAEGLADEARQLLLQMPNLASQLMTSRQLVDGNVNLKQPVSFE
jgi:hypothetical protein